MEVMKRMKLSQLYELKLEPQDFRVIEDLDIEMSGDGEHLWLFVEKQNLTTDIVRHVLSKVFLVAGDQVSAAGKKDRHGITRQWYSIRLPGTAPAQSKVAAKALAEYLEATPLYDGELLEIVETSVHNKKCQVGCHRGNFFEINAFFSKELSSLLQKKDLLCPEDETKLSEQLLNIQQNFIENGFANYFGEQRFGGVDCLTDIEAKLSQVHKKTRPGRLKPKDAWAFSQVRSFLFNEVLRQRQALGSWRKPQIGDLMNLTGSGSCFLVESLDDELLQRAVSGDVVVTGPLFGREKRSQVTMHDTATLEASVLEGLSEPGHQKLMKFQEAARRPLCVHPQAFHVVPYVDRLTFKFWLPKGAYATECIRAFFEVWVHTLIGSNPSFTAMELSS